MRPPSEFLKLYFFHVFRVLRVTKLPSPPAKKWPQSVSKSSTKTVSQPYDGVGAMVGEADGADVGEDDGEEEMVGTPE